MERREDRKRDYLLEDTSNADEKHPGERSRARRRKDSAERGRQERLRKCFDNILEEQRGHTTRAVAHHK